MGGSAASQGKSWITHLRERLQQQTPNVGISFNSCTLKFPRWDHNWTGFGIHWRIFCRCLDHRNWSFQMWSKIKMISSGFSSINHVSSNVKNLRIDLTADSRHTWQGMDSWSRWSIFDGRPFLGLPFRIAIVFPSLGFLGFLELSSISIW